MNHKTYGFFGIIFIVLFLLISCTKQSSIDCSNLLLSPINSQEVYANTRAHIPLTLATSQLDNTKFTIIDGPTFIHCNPTNKGRAELILDPTSDDIGTYQISLEATNGIQKACLDFTINVQAIQEDKRKIYCDTNKENGGDGTFENPYGTLSQLLKSGFIIEENDVILLDSGNHGNVRLTGKDYEIFSINGSTPQLNNLSIAEAENIKIQGIEFRPILNTNLHDTYIVYIDSTAKNITFSNNTIRSIVQSDQWTMDDWNKSAARGIKCLGNNVVIKNNLIQNVFHGIKTEGAFIETIYNHVDRFGGDAIRNTGSNNTYNFNFLTNATVDDYYAEGGNHDDLFQSWTFDKPIDNITLRKNIMISCLDTVMPFRAKIVQGLVCFDGFTTNWDVEANIVITDHPHGIALYGATECKILNNTVLKNPHNLYTYESDPWIMINKHKDGRKSTNNSIVNNVTSALNISEDSAELSGNTLIDSSKNHVLTNYNDWDFSIKK